MMNMASISYRVHQCSKCPQETEYLCETCPCDLCFQCKKKHLKDLKTIDHSVVAFSDKYNNISTQEICARHPRNVYKRFCETCHEPVCDSLFGNLYHRYRFPLFKHNILCIREVYRAKREKHRETIHAIGSEAFFYRPLLMSEIKAAFKTCLTNVFLYQSELITKTKTFKGLIDYIQNDLMHNVFCDFDFKHRCSKQKIEMSRRLISLQRYVTRYEQSAICPLKFILFIKTINPPQIYNLTLHTSQLSMNNSLNKEDVMKLLSGIQIPKTEKQRVEKECLLNPEFPRLLSVTNVDGCFHISCVTQDRVWVSDRNNIILTTTTGETLHRVKDLCSDLFSGYGVHTVNSESELIYVDRIHNIKKLSKDMKTTNTFIKKPDSIWEPRCVYWSSSTEDLLVGMCVLNPWIGLVTRYNQIGQLTQTIQCDNRGRTLYILPRFITENNNGDVLVSDSGAVVVTERGGKHRFSYTGHLSGSKIQPRGICTDELSHILVCDGYSNTVQMLDKNGQFMSHLLVKPSGIYQPSSLSYDVSTRLLWVGSGLYNNKLCVYRFVDRRYAFTDQRHMMESKSDMETKKTEKPHKGNKFLLKLMSSPKLLHFLTVRGVRRCGHISYKTPDWFCVSDDRNNLILTNTTGVILHHVNDLCEGICIGPHTINLESELFYIEKNYHIKKLSKDMKTNSVFIEETDSTWRPQCLFWSLSSRNLLVGMYNEYIGTCKVIRYNKNGQLIQTIQHDNSGQELYRKPNFVTENNNGDVVVSDSDSFYATGAVVVTGRGGSHRFSYTGPPSGSGLKPRGICTDALSHILVCDGISDTVQIIDKNGQFLSSLLGESQKLSKPWSLDFDTKTQRLLVGSYNNNKLCVYKYMCITRPNVLKDETEQCTDGNVLFSSIPA